MKIEPGAYITETGTIAWVWDWGKNLLGEECWRGTIKNVGFITWDQDGRALVGDEHLVKRIEEETAVGGG